VDIAEISFRGLNQKEDTSVSFLVSETKLYNLSMDSPQSEIEIEFEKAASARTRGNEGQARVCARRAAGIAVREYLARHGTPPRTASAYDLLNLIKDDPALSPDLKLIADHLTVRVTEEFKLPVDADLVAEAKTFCEELLK
jgi:HEPN domain-containing protein